MSWRNITEADVLTKISGAELSGYRKAVLAGGQADPVQPSIDLVTAKVRGFVAGNSANTLSSDAAQIPDRLIGAAVALIIIEIMSRVAGKIIDPEGARRKDADEANRLLRDVAAGHFSINDPVSGRENTGGGASVVGRRAPRVNRQNLQGT